MRRSLAALIVASCGSGSTSAPVDGGVGDPDARIRADAGPFVPPAATCAPPATLVDTTEPDRVVGTGLPGSCTEAALAAAIAVGGTIKFNCGPNPHTIAITSELVVTADTVLDGNGRITLDGGDATRLLAIHGSFDQAGPTLTVQRMTLARGHAEGTMIPLGTDVDGGGGAIFHLGGTVVAIDSRFIDNRAALEGPDVAGGAIYGIGVGATTVVGCEFIGNRASNGGALGSLFNELTIVNSTLEHNEATGHGANYIDAMGMQAGHGGNGGAVAMDGEGRTLTICGSRFAHNRGGAIGGAVFRTSYSSEPTVIDRSTFDDNWIVDHVDEPGQTSLAGGLYLQGSSVTITASTISRNRATGVGGLWIGNHGSAQASLSMTNVTIASNEVYEHAALEDTGLAGGIWIDVSSSGTLVNCTIADNFAQFGAGVTGIGALTLRNTIVWNRSSNAYVPINCTNLPPGGGSPADGTRNLQWPRTNAGGDDFPCSTDVGYALPLLNPLGSNGGPTETMAPSPDSPAYGGGTSCPPFDQRGVPRMDPCTIGAVE